MQIPELRQAKECLWPESLSVSTSVHLPPSAEITAARGRSKPVSGLSVSHDQIVDSIRSASSLRQQQTNKPNEAKQFGAPGGG